MNREIARKVADSVLFEGYMLYPYRASAIKNRQRWTFGILYPEAYPEVSAGTERRAMHSEFLVEAAGEAKLEIELRFLHLVARQVERGPMGVTETFEPVASLTVDGKTLESWDEAVVRSVTMEIALAAGASKREEFRFGSMTEREMLTNSAGENVGAVSRTQQEVAGSIAVRAEELRQGVLKVFVDVANDTASPEPITDRNAALMSSLLSAHAIVTAEGAQFVSLLDAPEELKDAVKECRNVGNFPVLVGEEPERDMLLCSPIVLYDYPQVAPESNSDFFDATEMDEMLTLRIMTLTEEEKGAMRMGDEHVRTLLERTEQSAREQLARTHGTIRSMRPVSEK